MQNDIVTPEEVSNPAANDSPKEEGTIQTIYEGLTERERYQEPKQITYESLRLEENTKVQRFKRKQASYQIKLHMRWLIPVNF